VPKRHGFEFGSYRECPACHNKYSTRVEDGHLYWYLRKTIRSVYVDDDDDGFEIWETREILVPSTYCKSCEKRRSSDGRRLRREIEKLPPDERLVAEVTQLAGDCDCCHKRMRRTKRELIAYGGAHYALCELCLDYCDIASWDADGARDVWLHLLKHNAHEKRLEAQWAERCDRRRQYHSTYLREDAGRTKRGTGWRNAKPEDLEGFPLAHVQCMWMEGAWKRVWRFLLTVPAHGARQIDDTSAGFGSTVTRQAMPAVSANATGSAMSDARSPSENPEVQKWKPKWTIP
jgi:hypothetical protein